MKNRKVFLFAPLVVAIFWTFILPGPRVATDYPYVSAERLKEEFSLPMAWTNKGAEGLGEYNVSTLWAYPMDFLYGVAAKVGLSFPVIERLLGVFLILAIGLVGINALTKHLKISVSGSFIASIFFVINTYILLVIDGGQFTIGLAYAWLPLAYLAVEKSILNSNFKSQILAGLAVAMLGIFDIRIVYLLIILLFLRFFYELMFLSFKKWGVWIFSWLKSGLIVVLIFTGLHAYWILPAIAVKIPELPLTYGRSTQISFLSFANLGHSLFLLQPHWYKNVFGKVTPLLPTFVFIPLLAFLAPILRKKDHRVGFWLIIALLAVFLTKGILPPFPQIYHWLFAYLPGFSVFRDPTKFFILVALSYSVLIGITAEELTKKINWSLRAIPILLTAYLLLLISPVYTGKMTGTLSVPPQQEEYAKVANIIQKDSQFSRVFWIPSLAPLGYSSPTHPTLEASRLVQSRPFAIGTVGTYETFNFIREAPFIGQLFDIAGIKYIVYPYPDTRREELKEDNIVYYHAFLDQISNLSWVGRRLTDAPVPLLETKKQEDHFFLVPETFWVVGSDRIYWDLVAMPNFDLAKNALVFAEEQAGRGSQIEKIPQAKVLLYDKKPIDFAASFIDKTHFIFPAKFLSFDPDPSARTSTELSRTSSGQAGWPASRSFSEGWWKREAADLIKWRAFLQEKYGLDNLDFDYSGGWAVAEGNKQLAISNQQLANENLLLARVMKSNHGGKISFYQGEYLIGGIETKIVKPEKVQIKLTGYKDTPDKVYEYDKADFGWFEVGKLTISGEPLTIKTEGDINVVNALAVISPTEWDRVNEGLQRFKIVEWNKLTDTEKLALFKGRSEASLNYVRINPTHYKVKIEGLSSSAVLAFSESYDPLWQVNSEGSLPLYSLINGFNIKSDGEYDIEYLPQRYVLPGFCLTVATSIILISSLPFLRRKKGQI